eukprot:m.243200 g.243200  ORF g.243200 m.243200 type:complete len:154 (+) comp27111_c0_seq1:58-519(+)
MGEVVFEAYRDETQLPAIMGLISKDLSEPYSVYTYRFFIHSFPQLCILAYLEGQIIGVVVCRQSVHKTGTLRGYVAMLAVDAEHRRRHIGIQLVQRAVRTMQAANCDEVVLEAEISNTKAIALYERLGFVRDKSLPKYYLNSSDAVRLKLWLK